MNRLGIIVDGPGDFKSLKYKFKDKFKILKTDGPRGHCAAVDEIILGIRKQVDILQGFRCSKVIVLLDFECRRCAYDDFLKDLKNEIKKHNFPISVTAVVSNTMIENWYLSDIETISKLKVFIRDNLKQKQYEGTHGKDELKKLFKPKFSYNETIHGPQIFEVVTDTTASKNSKSYKIFLDEIDGF